MLSRYSILCMVSNPVFIPIHILHLRKLKLRKVKQLAESHTARMSLMQDLNPGLSLYFSILPTDLSSTDFLYQTTFIRTFIWFTETTQGTLTADDAIALES